ncbi:MAG: LytTR family DNA-binding domain-containing protein [Bacteroidetes bacterium]|nr:LytTR family DNA-binding domain-containing protein [Bacteroidota bacterium]
MITRYMIMILKCIIVDDDELSRKMLEKLCAQIEDLDVKGLFSCAMDALRYLDENLVDLIFLDIEMPEMTGLDMLSVRQDLPPVIFITGKGQYAIQAFEHNVTDYLVKPVNLTRLVKAVEKVKQQLTKHQEKDVDHIFIRSGGRFIRLRFSDIRFIESIGDYIAFHTKNGKHIHHSSLRSIEKQLNNKDFVKVHRSYIVNIHHIDEIEDNTLVIGDELIPVSRSNRSVLFQKLRMLE